MSVSWQWMRYAIQCATNELKDRRITVNLPQLPYPSDKRIALHVTPAAERALQHGHPWLFDGGIVKQSHAGESGDLAVVFDSKRRFLAIGLYDPHSPIRVKVLQHRQSATIDRDWFQRKIAHAVALRAPLPATQTSGYRLIHGENDGLPGLIVDRYAEVLVMKLYTAAWIPHLRDVLPALLNAQPAESLILRLSRALQNQPDLLYRLSAGQILVGEPLTEPVIFMENGLRFAADVVHGHKTGFFFDHRDNRAEVGRLAGGKRILDVFAYSGGFSLYAARGGAKSVLSLDVSEPALQTAKRNFTLNMDDAHVARAQHDIMIADAFDGLRQLRDAGQSFDLIVVDPPSFAKSHAEVPGALNAYARLTRSALDLLESDGTLVMASCSSRVADDDFYATVVNAASEIGRPLRILKRSGHALDHPIAFPEGAYLKCLFATDAD
jgi:23S rRNA (cytosine1962-C5)-methyltransferase